MTFLAPVFVYVALGVAALVAGLHFIVTRQPPSSPLPTVRFVPRSQVRVTTISRRPEDLLLLAARVVTILLIGAALARPVIVPIRRPVVRFVLADASRDVGSIEAVRDSARALLGSGNVLVTFDSAARAEDGGPGAAQRLAATARDGRLSPALVAALRTASRIRDRADSFELVVVSPLRASEFDGATEAIRSLWPGRIRLVQVPAAGKADTAARVAGIALQAAADDPIAVALEAAGVRAGGSEAAVRVARGTASAADSVWAARAGHTLVRWPSATSAGPPGWDALARPDTVSAVIAGEAALVYPLARVWRLDTAVHPTRVAARWVDGAPAAVEREVGGGCIRDVAIPVPAQGDLVLRPAFARLLEAFVAPCEGAAGGVAPAAPPAETIALAGAGPLAARGRIPAPETVATPLVPWLLAAALLLVLLEPLVRRGSAPRLTALDAAPEAEGEAPPGAAA